MGCMLSPFVVHSIRGEVHIDSGENFMENLDMNGILQQKHFLHIETLHLDIVCILINCVGPALILTMHDIYYTLT